MDENTPLLTLVSRNHHCIDQLLIVNRVMFAEFPTQGHAQFWWTENASADSHLCNVDVYDESLDIYRPDIYNTISETISNLDHELRLLSLDIHSTLTIQ